MRSLNSVTLVVPTLVLLLLSGCSGTKGVRVIEGSEQIGAAPRGSLYVTNEATVVHVNEIERLATLSNGRLYDDGAFLSAKDSSGKESAILKVRPNRSGLRTADILEGLPKINDLVGPVSQSESERLGKIYRDPVEE